MKRLNLVFLILLLGSIGTSAHAVLISTSIGKYEVTSVNEIFNNEQTTLEAQAWWNSEALAEEFSNLVLATGIQNYTFAESFVSFNNNVWRWSCCEGPPTNLRTFRGQDSRTTISRNWAIAVRVPEPTILTLMGLGLAGVGFSRRKTR